MERTGKSADPVVAPSFIYTALNLSVQVEQTKQRIGVGRPEVIPSENPKHAGAVQEILKMGLEQVETTPQRECYREVDAFRFAEMVFEMRQKRIA
jgi:hypothetical protein